MGTWGTSHWKCGSKYVDQDTNMAGQLLNEYLSHISFGIINNRIQLKDGLCAGIYNVVFTSTQSQCHVAWYRFVWNIAFTVTRAYYMVPVDTPIYYDFRLNNSMLLSAADHHKASVDHLS